VDEEVTVREELEEAPVPEASHEPGHKRPGDANPMGEFLVGHWGIEYHRARMVVLLGCQ